MNKKGEMTTQQIVLLIILIASFAIILFLFFRLNLGNESEKDLCHNSVVLKKTLPTKDAIPLNCQRSYVCISENGKCDSLVKPELKKVKTDKEVYGVLAEELKDCWWMFGEGKIDYVGKDTFSELYCSLCSQIAFDESVKGIFSEGSFSKEEFYDYMVKTKIENEEYTYAEYLYGSNDLKVISGDKEFGTVNLDSQYFAMMGMASQTSTWSWIGIGAGVVVFGTLTAGGGFGALAIATGVGGSSGGFLLAPIAKWSEKENKILLPWIIEVNSPEYNALGCKDITTLS